MRCEEFETYVVDYIDQDMERSLVMEMEAHVESCGKCRSELEQYQELLHTISQAKQENPDHSLRMDFHKNLKESTDHPAPYRWSFSFIRIAASIALLVAGAFIGYTVQRGFRADKQADQIDNLQLEIGAMKEVLMFTLLDEESPSQRIKAVKYTEEIPNPDSNIIDVLVSTLNNDKSVNVRVAAAYSLARYSDDIVVRDSLISSLENQSDPIIQVILMNILVEHKETRAIETMRELISDENTIVDVKDIAEKSINVLL
jgi:hypothetical protein